MNIIMEDLRYPLSSNKKWIRITAIVLLTPFIFIMALGYHIVLAFKDTYDMWISDIK